jgi:hypothetical protein
MRKQPSDDLREKRRPLRAWALPVLLTSAALACVPREELSVIGDRGTSPAVGGSSSAGAGSSSAGTSSSSAGGTGGAGTATGGTGQGEEDASSGDDPGPEVQGRCDSFDGVACMSECLNTEVVLRNDGGTVDMATDCKQAYADVIACQIGVNYWKCDIIPDSTKCFAAGYYEGCGLVDAGSLPTHPVTPYWTCGDQMNYLQGCVAGWYRPIPELDAGADAVAFDAAPSPSLEPLCAELCRVKHGYQIRDGGAPL